MPWVKLISSLDLADRVRDLSSNANRWVAKEGTESQRLLFVATDWAMGHMGDAGLTVIAGSLYLVADFYRNCERTV